MAFTGKLLIATPFYSMQGWSPYISALVKSIRILDMAEVTWDFWNLSGDSYIDRARNKIANDFMESEFTDLLFIDSDMSWDEMGFARLLCRDEEIVGCGYPCKNNWDFFGCLLNTTGPEGKPIVENGLLSAQSAPTGLMKIKRTVFEKLAQKDPDNYYMDNAQKPPKVVYNFFGRMPPLGEDTSFCKRWRDIGGKIWVEPNVTINHYGFKAYTGNYHEFLLNYKPEVHDIDEAVAIVNTEAVPV